MRKQKIIIFDKIKDLQKFCAEQFIAQVHQKPNSIIGFATGVSPVEAYQYIIEDYQKKGTSWKNIVGFSLDEFVGINVNHPQAFIKQMKDNLYNYIDIKKENINIPNAQALDPHLEAKNYEKTLREKGPIDFQYISIGINGHIAYNEPGTPFDSLTHVTNLTSDTINDMVKKGKFVSVKESPKQAITMGIKTLLTQTKKIMAVSYGAHKASVTKIMLEAKPNRQITATALQNHPNCFYVLDKGAASKLSPKTLKCAEYR